MERQDYDKRIADMVAHKTPEEMASELIQKKEALGEYPPSANQDALQQQAREGSTTVDQTARDAEDAQKQNNVPQTLQDQQEASKHATVPGTQDTALDPALDPALDQDPVEEDQEDEDNSDLEPSDG